MTISGWHVSKHFQIITLECKTNDFTSSSHIHLDSFPHVLIEANCGSEMINYADILDYFLAIFFWHGEIKNFTVTGDNVESVENFLHCRLLLQVIKSLKKSFFNIKYHSVFFLHLRHHSLNWLIFLLDQFLSFVSWVKLFSWFSSHGGFSRWKLFPKNRNLNLLKIVNFFLFKLINFFTSSEKNRSTFKNWS